MISPSEPLPSSTAIGVLTSAHRVLSENRRHGLTVPHRRMFPAGYLWDTGVTARGIAVYDPSRAAAEVVRYLQSQWRSGMIPNEVYFHRVAFRERIFGVHPDRPRGLTTSGITQPPWIVRAVLEVGRRLDREAGDRFHAAVIPSLVRWSRWVLDHRIGRRGLAVVIHPYETGMDNRIDLAGAMTQEWLGDDDRFGGLALRGRLAVVAGMRRLWGDTRTVPVAQRSSHADVLTAFRQTQHIRRVGYDLTAIEQSGRGVLVEDVGFNAVLLDAFACLAELAAEADDRTLTRWLDDELSSATQRLTEALEGLWVDDPDDAPAGYYGRDYRTGRILARPTVAGLFPLLRSQNPVRTAALIEALTDPRRYWTRVAPPSAPVDSPGFAAEQYWRGAAWPFPVDILETALRAQDEPALAADLRRRYLNRPHAVEHAEYHHPLTGQPLGARGFSPSAALAVRLAAAEGLEPVSMGT